MKKSTYSKMDTNIYYDNEGQGLLVTSNFAEEKKWMDLGVNPKIEYRKIEISEVDSYKIVDVGFTKVEDDYFQKMKGVFSKLKLEAVAFNDSSVDLSNVTIDVRELFIGEKSNLNISANNFKNLEEITFFSVKSFKGKVLDRFDTVKKAIFWNSTKTSSFPEMFPNLTELTINKGGLTELDLRNNKELEKLGVHYCSKLEKILLPNHHKLNDVFIENCKNLDISNLPSLARIWPQRKVNAEKKSSDIVPKSTGNKQLDSLILDLKKNMEDYMHENDPSYTHEAQKRIKEDVSMTFRAPYPQEHEIGLPRRRPIS